MSAILERINGCASFLEQKLKEKPKIAVVLGSGLGGFADSIENGISVEYRDIPGFPVSTVEGHRGRFVFGKIGEKPVAIMQGRVHFYEGYSMEDVVLPIRVLRALGAEKLVLTNAAGGIGNGLTPGDLMLLTDHIASFVPSPLLGPNESALGPRFPDMSEVYSNPLQEKARQAALETGVSLKNGVYLQVTGPSYETPAEVRLYKALGADAVGMSTAVEAVCARHMGMEVCGISCITNLAAGLSKAPLSHEEVQETADHVAAQFQKLLRRLLELM
ncbi:MAG: purine-nucleoside phosphorylase [Acutalibacter sp.]|nr:purine-nucleoside phosphorylase [Acutalibacter sp.]